MFSSIWKKIPYEAVEPALKKHCCDDIASNASHQSVWVLGQQPGWQGKAFRSPTFFNSDPTVRTNVMAITAGWTRLNNQNGYYCNHATLRHRPWAVFCSRAGGRKKPRIDCSVAWYTQWSTSSTQEMDNFPELRSNRSVPLKDGWVWNFFEAVLPTHYGQYGIKGSICTFVSGPDSHCRALQFQLERQYM